MPFPLRVFLPVVAAAALTGALAAPGPVAAQPSPVRFDRLSTEDGLSNDNVKGIHQDRRGFLWISTDRGLNRFDGYAFRVFRHDPDDSTSVGDDVVNAVLERSDGRFWVATAGGLNVLDPASATFTRLRHDPEDPSSVPPGPARAIALDPDGSLWVATGTLGLYRIEPDSGVVERFRHDPDDPGSLSNDAVAALRVDRSGRLWVAGQQAGISLLDRETRRFRHWRHDPDDPGSLVTPFVRTIAEDSKGLLYLGLWRGGIARLDPERPGRFFPYRHDPEDPGSLSEDNLSVLYVDRSDVLWAATVNGGLNRLDLDDADGRFARFRHEPGDPWSLGSTDVRAVFEDAAGVLWFGTERAGLSRHDPLTRRFGHVYHDPGRPGSIGSGEVTAILRDPEGSLWIATRENGLDRFDRRTGRFVHFRTDPDDPGSLPDDRVLSLYSDRPGELWVGTWAGGLSRLDTRTGRFERFRNDPAVPGTVPSGGALALAASTGGRFWLGAGGGLARWDPSIQRFERFAMVPAPIRSVSALLEDRNGVLWFTSDEGGLRQLDPKTGETAVVAGPGGAVRVLSLFEAQDGGIWVGTTDGLARVDASSGTLLPVPLSAGPLVDVVVSIEEDDEGRLWLGTEDGIVRYDPSVGSAVRFDETDGLQARSFSQASFRDRDGMLYFGGRNGYNAFRPENLASDASLPAVAFTRLEVPPSDGVGAATEIDLYDRTSVELSYLQRLLIVDFAVPGYRTPGRVRYEYRLTGLSDTWTPLGDGHRLTLTGLSPGSYVLEVRSAASSGAPVLDVSRLAISITPPWWRSNLAYVLYLLVAVAGLAAVRRYELNRIRLKDRLAVESSTAEKLRELDQHKSRFLANLSHEFRTPLTLIIGPLQRILASEPAGSPVAEDHRVMLRNARRLQRLINQVLDLSRLESSAMDLATESRDVNALVRSIVSAMHPLAEREGVTLSGPAPEPMVAPIDEDHMEKVFGNLVSNALKFTERGGFVEVSMQRGVAWIEITVADSGLGIPPEHLAHVFDRFYQADSSPRRRHEGTGIGLALAKELVELHGGTISVSSEPGRGSTFVVRLPAAAAPVADVSPRVAAPEDIRALPGGLPPSPSRPVEATPRAPADGDRTRILVVDDNDDVRRFVRSLLEPHHEVVEAGDGAEGLASARASLPDLVIADVMMPKLDGFELGRLLKNDPMLAGVPVILLTARSGIDDEIEGLETGADHFVRKPFEPGVLLATVRNLLTQRERLRAWYGAVSEPTDLPLSAFAARVLEVVDGRLDDALLSVETLSDDLALSASQVRRRVKEEFGVSPNEFIRNRRLDRSVEMLRAGAGTVSEIAFAVGFNSLHYFSRAFSAHFGKAPSEYLRGRGVR